MTGGSPQTAKVGTGVQHRAGGRGHRHRRLPGDERQRRLRCARHGGERDLPGRGEVTVTVPTSTSGVATAPTFTANDVSGSYTVLASLPGGNEVSYRPDEHHGGGGDRGRGEHRQRPVRQSWRSVRAQPLTVNVLDSYGDPISGATVSFTVVTNNGATATFVGGGASTTAQTSEAGTATSPALVAGSAVGSFTVMASVSGVNTPATFTLTDLASAPYAMTAGAGSSQNTELGTDFAVPLAVTVTDSNSNAIAGASVTFSAPTSGASGVFAGAGASAVVAHQLIRCGNCA